MEQMDYSLLFRWFVGLDIDDPVRDNLRYSKLELKVVAKFLAALSVGGSLLDRWHAG
jgi:hypothetical protein